MRTLISSAAIVLAIAACSPAEDKEDTTDINVEAPAPVAPPPAVVVLTEQDARSRIEAAGYTNVTALTQQPDGTWTATATRDGVATQISVGESGVTVVTAP